jgi:hypothetical protein
MPFSNSYARWADFMLIYDLRVKMLFTFGLATVTFLVCRYAEIMCSFKDDEATASSHSGKGDDSGGKLMSAAPIHA